MVKTLLSFKAFIEADFDKKSYALVFLFLTGLILFNYTVDFEDRYLGLHKNTLLGGLFYFAFYAGVYLFGMVLMKNNEAVKKALVNPAFYGLLALGIGAIAFEINYNIITQEWLSQFNKHRYFNFKLANQLSESVIFMLELILIGGIIGKNRFKGYGLWNFNSKLRIYLIFLLIMIPILYLASTQSDFIAAYPKLKIERFNPTDYLGYFMIYEPFYLLNFIRIEWIFRGFMVLALLQFLDRRTVILIAMVYCVFHFGKPMGECISSFFGGYILGMMVYYSKSIWGGIIIHMGIAFFMDLFALIAKLA